MKTKEQLVSENAKLAESIRTLESRDSIKRSQFARVLKQTDNRYGAGNIPRDMSWEEIFCETGKLISFMDFRRWKDDIEFRFDALKSEVQKPSPVS